MKRAVAITGLLLAGCQYNPFAHEFTTRRPLDESVVGVYRPDHESNERLRSALDVELDPDCKLILNSDKTFVARELPRFWILRSTGRPSDTDVWKGTWTLAQVQNWWAVRLHIESLNGEPMSFVVPAMLRGDAPPYLVHLTIGDPDSGDALAFQRESSTPD